jgi:hypothetical protein
MRRTFTINPKYASLRDFLLSLPDRFEAEGTYIYGGRRNLIKSFAAPDGTLLNVKRYHKPHGPNLLIYSSGLRKPKGRRAYTYAGRLLSRGISTPEPVAYIEERSLGMLQLSYFVSLQCPYPHRLYELGNAEPAQYEPLAEALARFTANMHDHEVLHLDFSPGNILWEKEGDEYHFSVVDINRMRFGSVSLRQGCTSFARLWGPKRFISILCRRYAELRHFDPDEAEAITMSVRRKFWMHYQKKREMEFKLEL